MCNLHLTKNKDLKKDIINYYFKIRQNIPNTFKRTKVMYQTD